MSSFAKTVAEQYPISVQFSNALPEGASLVSGTISATDTYDGEDVTADVLDSATLVIDGTQAIALVQAGEQGRRYDLAFLVTLTPGSQPPMLEEHVLMVVQ